MLKISERKEENGALTQLTPTDILAKLLRFLKNKYDLDTRSLMMLLGCVTPIGEQGGNIAKAALQYAEWDYNVRVCKSIGLRLCRVCKPFCYETDLVGKILLLLEALSVCQESQWALMVVRLHLNQKSI